MCTKEVWTDEALLPSLLTCTGAHVTIGRWTSRDLQRTRPNLWVRQAVIQTVASTDETFLPCGSPYNSSHWIGRSVSGVIYLRLSNFALLRLSTIGTVTPEDTPSAACCQRGHKGEVMVRGYHAYKNTYWWRASCIPEVSGQPYRSLFVWSLVTYCEQFSLHS